MIRNKSMQLLFLLCQRNTLRKSKRQHHNKLQAHLHRRWRTTHINYLKNHSNQINHTLTARIESIKSTTPTRLSITTAITTIALITTIITTVSMEIYMDHLLMRVCVMLSELEEEENNTMTLMHRRDRS